MSNLILNPYHGLTSQWPSAIAAAVSPTPVDAYAMNSQIVANLSQNYFPIAAPQPTSDEVVYFATIDLASTLASIGNDYMTDGLHTSHIFNGVQLQMINSLLDRITKVSVTAIPALLTALEDSIGKSGLTKLEKAPLFMATMVGAAAYSYWCPILTANSIAAPWVSYFMPQTTAPVAFNVMSLPALVSTAMEGALLGYINFFDVTFPKAHGNMILAMLAGSVSVTAGKVIFGWMPVMQPITLSALNNNNGNNLPDAIMGHAHMTGQKNGPVIKN